MKPSLTIDYWWDKHIRAWTIVTKDPQGNQVGCADYAPNKTRRDGLIEHLVRSDTRIYDIRPKGKI